MRRSLTITVAILLTLGFVASGCSSDKKSDTATTGTSTEHDRPRRSPAPSPCRPRRR